MFAFVFMFFLSWHGRVSHSNPTPITVSTGIPGNAPIGVSGPYRMSE